MGITKDNAKLAGEIAARMDAVEASIAHVQAAINGNASAETLQAQIKMADGTAAYLKSDIPMSAADTATILAVVLQVYQAGLAALAAQLDAM